MSVKMFIDMCRICLVGNVRIYRIEDSKLLEMFAKLASCKLNSDDGMPTTVCYICVSQLRRCRRFFDMVNESTRALTHLLHNGIEVSLNNMPPNLGETHNLTVRTLPKISIVSSDHENSSTESNQETIVKEEILEDLITIEESTINIDIYPSPIVKQEQVFIKQETEDCDANYTNFDPKQIAVKNEINDKDYIDVSSLCDISCGDINPLPESSNEKSQPVERDTYYDCDKCNKRYITKINLIKHLGTHSGGLPYSCKTCNKAFVTSASLKRHLLMHTVGKQFLCATCNKAFQRTGDLKRHMRIHSNEKPFVCESCQKPFLRAECLKQHIRIHTGEKPFICNICNKAFNAAANLKTHMRIHTGEKPYPCEICRKAFKSFAYLKKHTLLHSE